MNNSSLMIKLSEVCALFECYFFIFTITVIIVSWQNLHFIWDCMCARYFTWDKISFPNPSEMISGLSSVGRKMVTIVDPHIRRDDEYHIYKEALAGGYLVLDKNGAVYEGWCWPGTCSFMLPSRYYFDPGRSMKYCDQYYVCLFVHLHNLKTTQPNLPIFCMHVAYGPCSVLLWWYCDTLCTSSFLDDIIFHIMALWHLMCIPKWQCLICCLFL